MSFLQPLQQRKLVVVTGKGGVGKSALTSALGRLLAAAGRRTLMLEVDPRENLHQLLDVAPSGGEIVRVERGAESADRGGRLYLQNLKPHEVVDWVVRKQVKIEMVVERVQKSPVYHRFIEGAPGLKEMAILGHALRLVRGDMGSKVPPLDTVVLDAPATGHGVYLLTASRLYAEAIGEGPFAEMAREVADFTADAAACGVVVVTLAEEMPVQEALELRESLIERFGREPELLVVNGLYPAVPQTGKTPSGTNELLDLWRRRRDVNARELKRLGREWPGPRVDLPLSARRPRIRAGGPPDGSPRRRVRAGCMSGKTATSAKASGKTERLPLDLGSADPPLVIVVGSGGVGKTTLAAAMGVESAGNGLDTLVMTFDPSLRLKDALGVDRAAEDEEIEVPLARQTGKAREAPQGILRASLLDAGKTFDRLVDRYAPDAESRDRILGNRFYRHMAGHLGGILEYMAVERLYEVASEGRYDRIFLDTPPTTQAIDFLEAPTRIVEFLDSGVLKIALRPWFDDDGSLKVSSGIAGFFGRRLESFLDRIVGMQLLRDMSEFFRAFEPLFDGFRQRAEKVQSLLRNRGTIFVLVTGPGEARIPDTLFFARKLADGGHRLGPLVVNRVHPTFPNAGEGVSERFREGVELFRWLGDSHRRGLTQLRTPAVGGAGGGRDAAREAASPPISTSLAAGRRPASGAPDGMRCRYDDAMRRESRLDATRHG